MRGEEGVREVKTKLYKTLCLFFRHKKIQEGHLKVLVGVTLGGRELVLISWIRSPFGIRRIYVNISEHTDRKPVKGPF